jgi:hypothetical protein
MGNSWASWRDGRCLRKRIPRSQEPELERTTGFEPATPTLAKTGAPTVHRRSPRSSSRSRDCHRNRGQSRIGANGDERGGMGPIMGPAPEGILPSRRREGGTALRPAETSMLASRSKMFPRSRLVRRAASDPKLRVAIVFLLLFVALALAWHLVGMADHSTGMMGACIALLVVVGLVLLLREPLLVPAALPLAPMQSPMPALVLPGPTGRSPPQEGTVLLM